MKKRVLSLVFVLTIIFLSVNSIYASESEDTDNTPSRIISVVYDDSDSMLSLYSTAWCQAKYSLEIFSAMMTEKDTMNVYFMSDFVDGSKPLTKEKALSVSPTISNIKGSNVEELMQKNINTIHTTVTEALSTPITSIYKAYQDTKKATGYDEKWLFILTDGDNFTGIPNANAKGELEDIISDCDVDGINVVYLAIGEKTIRPDHDPEKGVFVYGAMPKEVDGENGILNRVATICQQVFQRPELKTAEVKDGFVSFDTPVSELIVFAQGTDISIGNIIGTKKITVTAEYTDDDWNKASLLKQSSASVNQIRVSHLRGQIAKFTPASGSYIKEGKYQLTVNATNCKVYYKPYVDLFVGFKDKNGTIYSSDQIVPPGDFELVYWLTYPVGHEKHGQELKSTLFTPTFTKTIEQNGVLNEIKSDNIVLTKGKHKITIDASYLEFNHNKKSIVIDVSQTVNVIETSSDEYFLSKLATVQNEVTLSVVKNGTAKLTREEWESVSNVSLTGDTQLDFIIDKSSELGKFTIDVSSSNEKLPTGKYNYSVSFETQLDEGEKIKTEYKSFVYVINDTAPILEIVQIGKKSFVMNEFKEGASTSLKLTLDGQDLSNSQINEFISNSSVVISSNKIGYSLKKGNEPSTVDIVLGFFNGDYKQTDTGKISFDVNGKVTSSGGLVSERQSKAEVDIQPYQEYIPKLDFEITGTDSFDLDELESGATMTVKATLDGENLTDEQIEELLRNENLVECKKNIEYTVEKGKDPSTFDIKMKYGEGGRLDTSVGKVPFGINGKLNAGDGVSEAKKTVSSNINDTVSFGERFGNFIKNNWWWLLGLLILIVIAIGYIPGVKKYIPKQFVKDPQVTTRRPGGRPNYDSAKFKKGFSSYIPYAPGRATLTDYAQLDKSVPNIKFKAVKGGVELSNYEDFVGGEVKVSFDGQVISKEDTDAPTFGVPTIVVRDGNIRCTCDPSIAYGE